MNLPGAAEGHLRHRPIGYFLWALFTWFAFVPSALWANPTGGSIVSGAASISSNGSTLNVVNSNGAVIDWQSFSIRAGETTNFLQPSVNSSVLNRVVGNNPSALYGTLSSNGRVLLINPNGIFVGPGGVINTAGFTASTLDVDNSQFTAGGGLQFSGASTHKVVNLGQITATDGDIYLISEHVVNKGSLAAANGNAGLYASDQVYLTTGPNGAGAVRVAALATGTGAPAGNGIVNSGTIQAVQVALKATGNLYALAINNTGAIRATGASVKNGVIRLTALGGTVENGGTLAARNADGSGGTVKMTTGAHGTTLDTGVIDVSSRTAGKTGGTVELTGDDVAVYGNALVDASGPAGGGAILIGGDLHGANAKVYDAVSTYIGEDAVLKADATDSGNGGKVVVWSNDATRFYGSISGRGGLNGGNGGQVETSGGYLEAFGTVDTSAPKGQLGSWLLDPDDLTIVNYPNDSVANIGVSSGPDFSAAIGDSASTLTDFSVNQALANNDVIVQADGSITIQADANLHWSSTHSLTMTAGTTITIDSAITAQGVAAIILTAGSDIDVNAPIATVGAITLRADSGGTGVGTVQVASPAYLSASGGLAIFYNPVSYTAPTVYTNVVGGPVTAYMLVNTAAQLQAMAAAVNTGGSSAYNFALGRSIDASGIANFTPVGSSSANEFSGIFNGNGYAISNLTITGGTVGIGLFGFSLGTIENVGLLNETINAPGGSQVGGLAGYNDGTINNSYVSGTGSITGSGAVGGLVGQNSGTVEHSYAAETAAASGSLVNNTLIGGLVGNNAGGTIKYSYALGNVNGLSVDGGLAGYNSGTIDYSYAAGAVSGTDAGGLVGDDVSGGYTGDYFNSDQNAVGIGLGNFSAQVVGLTTQQMMTPSSYTLWTGSNAIGIQGTALTAASWYIAGTTGAGAAGSAYPILTSEYSTTVTNGHQLELIGMNSTTLAAAYTQANDIDLSATGNGGDVWASTSDDWAPFQGFVPIGNAGFSGSATDIFSGTFNGNGNTVTNLTINVNSASNDVGLFGISKGTLNDIGMVNTIIRMAGGNSVDNIGALVGSNNGLVESSSSTGTGSISGGHQHIGGLVGSNEHTGYTLGDDGSISNSYSTISVSGQDSVGGLVGENGGQQIIGSYATGSVTALSGNAGGLVGNNVYGGTIEGSYSTSSVTGTNDVGGLVGISNGTVESETINGVVQASYATGAVAGGQGAVAIGGLVGYNEAGGSITGSYATGTVNSGPSGEDVGGLVGENDGTIGSSYATGAVNSNAAVQLVPAGGFVGLNTGTITGSYATGNIYSTSQNDDVGGFAGQNSGSISGSYATGSITASGNNDTLGGFVGNNVAGIINNSYATGAIRFTGQSVQAGGFVGNNNDSTSAINTSYAGGAVINAGGDTDGDVGGFAGSNSGAINNAYAYGAVSGDGDYAGGFFGSMSEGGAVVDSYSSGAVTGSKAGGFGGSNSGNITFSFWDSQTSGQNFGFSAGSDTGVSGLTTSEAMTQSTYLVQGGWNIGTDSTIDTWVILDGQTRPMLAMEYSTTISNAHQLQLVGLNTTTLTANYTLAANIDATGTYNPSDVWGTSLVNGTITGTGFIPIGSAQGANAFFGTLNGQGHTITGLTENVSGGNAGLFGALEGTVSNLGLVNVDIVNNDTAGVYTGGIAGILGDNGSDGVGVISQVYVSGSVQGWGAVGGVAGWNDYSGGISNSYSLATVHSNNGDAGGLIALDYDDGTVSDNYVNGIVTGNTAGGLVGALVAGIVNSSNFWNESLTAPGVGAFNQPTFAGQGITTAQAMQASTYTAAGWNIGTSLSNPWVILNGSTLPMLAMEYSTTLTNAHQLELVGLNATTLAAGYTLAGNLDLSTVANASEVWGGASTGFVPIGTAANPFVGTFNGGGHLIANLVIAGGGDAIGLFGQVGSSTAAGSIENVGLTNAKVAGSTPSGDVGTLVGDLVNGVVSQSFAAGTAAAAANSSVGGLVGATGANGTVENSYASVNLSLGGNDNAGGLVGSNGGTITDSYSTGMVAAAPGATANNIVGGLAGQNLGTITSSFWDIGTSGQTSGVGSGSSSGVEGESTSALQNYNFYGDGDSGWSLTDGAGNTSWGIADGSSYPYLQWEFPNGVQVIAGTAYTNPLDTAASAWSGEQIGLAVNGTVLGTTETGANGYFYQAVAAGSIAANDAILVYAHPGSASDSVSGTGIANTVYRSGGDTATSLTLTANMLTAGVSTESQSGGGFNNSYVDALISSAAGTLGDPAIIPSGSHAYDSDTNALTISAPGVGFSNLSGSGDAPLTLTGNITASGAIVLNSAKDTGGFNLTLTAGNGIALDGGSYTGSNNISLYSGTGPISLSGISIGSVNSPIASLTLSGGTAAASAAATGSAAFQDDGISIANSTLYAGTITATGQSDGATNSAGISLNGSTLETTDLGIVLTGTDAAVSGGNSRYGIEIANGSQVISNAGPITITGTSGTPGAAGLSNDYGVWITGGSNITTGGNITITGTSWAGGAAATGVIGVEIDTQSFAQTEVSASGSGNVSITGYAFGSGGTSQDGLVLDGYVSTSGSSVSSAPATVQVADGSLAITGVSGAPTMSGNNVVFGANGLPEVAATTSGTNSSGIILENGAQVNSTGKGTIALTGLASANPGNDNYGVDFFIGNNGFATGAGNNRQIFSGAVPTVNAKGTIVLQADSIGYPDSNNSENDILSGSHGPIALFSGNGTGSLTIEPLTASTTLYLGGSTLPDSYYSSALVVQNDGSGFSVENLGNPDGSGTGTVYVTPDDGALDHSVEVFGGNVVLESSFEIDSGVQAYIHANGTITEANGAVVSEAAGTGDGDGSLPGALALWATGSIGTSANPFQVENISSFQMEADGAYIESIGDAAFSLGSGVSLQGVEMSSGITLTGGDLEITATGTGGLTIDNDITMQGSGGQMLLDGGAGTGSEAQGEGSFALTNDAEIAAGANDVIIKGSGEIDLKNSSINGSKTLTFGTSSASASQDFTLLNAFSTATPNGAYLLDSHGEAPGDLNAIGGTFTTVSFAAAAGGDMYIFDEHSFNGTGSVLPRTPVAAYVFQGDNVYLGLDANQVTAALPSGPGTAVATDLDMSQGSTKANVYLVASNNVVLANGSALVAADTGAYVVLSGENIINSGATVTGNYGVYAAGGPAGSTLGSLATGNNTATGVYTGDSALPSVVDTIFYPPAATPSTATSTQPTTQATQATTQATGATSVSQAVSKIQAATQSSSTTTASTGDTTSSSSNSTDTGTGTTTGSGSNKKSAIIPPAPPAASNPGTTPETVVGAGASGAIGHGGFTPNVPPPPSLGSALTPAVRNELQNALGP